VAAEFLGPLMMRGTKKHTREQIETELDALGATLNAASDAGELTFTFQAKREKLPALLDLLGEILRTPTFPETEFDILKRADRQDLEKGLTDPQQLASNLLRRQLNPYPPDNVRYVPTLPEAIQRLDAVTRDQVVRIYQEQLGAQVGEFAVVGDFDSDATLKQVTAMTGDWKAAVPYQRIGREANTKVVGVVEKILTPDKENAVYLAGEVFRLKDTEPDYPALLMGNYILGSSGFNSRILDRLRQKEGLSYGAGSHFSADAQDPWAQFMFHAIYNPGVLEKVDQAMKEVLDKLLKDGVTEEELADAKKGYREERRVARASDRTVASMLTSGLYLGRTFAYSADLDAKVAAVTVADVNRALRAHLDPRRLVIVRAGDFGKSAGSQK
jgi:zinc protease